MATWYGWGRAGLISCTIGQRCVEGTRSYAAFARELNWCNLKLSSTSHFASDLGLDSLDTVEVVMAIEEVRILRGIRRVNSWYRRRNSASRFLIRRQIRSSAVSLPMKEQTVQYWRIYIPSRQSCQLHIGPAGWYVQISDKGLVPLLIIISAH